MKPLLEVSQTALKVLQLADLFYKNPTEFHVKNHVIQNSIVIGYVMSISFNENFETELF